MACASCGQNYGLPLHTEQLISRTGEPFSTACQRASTQGSIPAITRYPGWTAKEGTPIVGIPAPGNFKSFHNFWKGTPGCYGTLDGDYGVGVCA